jgi:TrmH family RNA methyltransferase
MGMATADIRVIHSRQNSRVKNLRAALLRPGRHEDAIGLEGVHLVQEALASGITVETVFVQAGKERLLNDLPLPAGIDILSLSAEVLASVVSTESPQPIAALARAPRFVLQDVFGKQQQTPLVIVSAGLQDPGNLGTLVRSAEAFGATGMVLLPGTVNLWNAKTLRASSGSAFRLPVVLCENDDLLQAARERGVKLLAAVARDAAFQQEDLRGPVALLIGNEGAGLPQVWINAADGRISIPCPGRTESLNAAVAGSVLLYEAARLRGLTQ